mmetsp:Transcript_34339/g.84464  ORF Transcript_34339/g.84464 Transcript_34339/m.84464 type:complete len:343 (+) Transcript_34339:146-1174(+)
MSPAATAYLGRIPDDRQYMVAAGGMRGNKTQSCAESFNNSNSKARLRHLYGALKQLVVDDRRRFYQRKQWANAGRDNLDEATGLHPSMQVSRSFSSQGSKEPMSSPASRFQTRVTRPRRLCAPPRTSTRSTTRTSPPRRASAGCQSSRKGPASTSSSTPNPLESPFRGCWAARIHWRGTRRSTLLISSIWCPRDLTIREPDRQQRAPSPGGEAQSWAPCCEEEEVCYREVWGDEAGQGHVLKVRPRRAHLAQMPRDEGIWGNHRRRGGRKWVNPSQRARAWHGWRARGTEGHCARAALRALCAHRAGAPRAAPLPRARDEVHCVHGALHSAHAHAHRVCRVG